MHIIEIENEKIIELFINIIKEKGNEKNFIKEEIRNIFDIISLPILKEIYLELDERIHLYEERIEQAKDPREKIKIMNNLYMSLTDEEVILFIEYIKEEHYSLINIKIAEYMKGLIERQKYEIIDMQDWINHER